MRKARRLTKAHGHCWSVDASCRGGAWAAYKRGPTCNSRKVSSRTSRNCGRSRITLADACFLLGGILRPPTSGTRGILLSFNSGEGGRHGYSHVVEVPPNLVADVAVLPLAEASLPRLRPDDPELDFLKEILGEVTDWGGEDG